MATSEPTTELDARYGGVREFLLSAGATGDELDRAVARLL